MKWTSVIAATALGVQLATASAQSIGAPLIFEGGDPLPLAGAAPAENARAGDEFLLPFALRNRSADNAWMRRIVFRVLDGLEIADPTTDRIDNDRDGSVDEGDEDFTSIDGTAIAWLGDPSDAPVPPGASVERAVKLRLLPDMEAGSSATLEILAAASNGDLAMRAEHTVDFDLRPPTLTLSLDESEGALILLPNETPLARAILTIPSGAVPDLSLMLEGTPSIARFEDARAGMGDGITCSIEGEPMIETEGRSATARFGACRADPNAAEETRIIWLEAEAKLQDADAFAGAGVIFASRAVQISAAASRGERTLAAPMRAAARIAGPLIGGQLLDATDDPVDAGDRLSATLRLINRGDAVTGGLRLIIRDDGAVDCASLRLKDQTAIKDACGEGVPLADLSPGQTQEFGFSAYLRDDASFRGEMALQMAVIAENIAETPLPAVPYLIRLPEPPVLSLGDNSDWSVTDGILTARIGDAGIVEVTGTLPEGQYPARLRLLARSVDAQTGEPTGPAPVIAKSLEFRSGSTPGSGDLPPIVGEEGGWTVIEMPMPRLSVPADGEADASRFEVIADLVLRDVSEAQAGRVVELTAKLDLFDAVTIGGDSWIEFLIVEPSVELTVRSPDEDRSIELGASAEIAALACNRGLASVHGLVMRADVPPPLRFDGLDRARFVTLPIERAADTALVFASRPREVGLIVPDAGKGVLRGVLSEGQTLKPDTCAALLFSVKRSSATSANNDGAMVKAAVEPYKGREGTRARLYPAINGGGIRFTLPPLRFGPVSEVDIGGARIITHDVSLTLPRGLGPQRVTLIADSAENLEWTMLQLDGKGVAAPWRNGAEVEPGSTLRFRLEATNVGNLPLGWVDTTLVRAVIFPSSGDPVAVSTRLVSRRGEALGGEITIVKTLALDRDCDGDIGDERVQDALFEPVKDASIGDCVIFRVVFRHSGSKDMEQIVVRDSVPSGTELRADAVEVLRAPEPLQNVQVLPPKTGSSDLVWRFDGLFKPGAEGEVSYAVKLTGKKGAPK